MVTATTEEIEEGENREKKFSDLVRLGTDDRTPSHERDNACRAACQMIADKTIDGWHMDRGKKLKDAVAVVKSEFARIRFSYR